MKIILNHLLEVHNLTLKLHKHYNSLELCRSYSYFKEKSEIGKEERIEAANGSIQRKSFKESDRKEVESRKAEHNGTRERVPKH